MENTKLLLILVAAVVMLNIFTVIYFASEMSKQASCNAPVNTDGVEQTGCGLGGLFSCSSYSVVKEGVMMQIKSSEAVFLKSAAVSGCGTATLNKQIERDVLSNVIIPCSNDLNEGENFSGNILLKYSKPGENEEKQASGKLNSVVESS